MRVAGVKTGKWFRRLLAALVLVTVLGTAGAASAAVWTDNVVSSPGANTVVVDTGSIVYGTSYTVAAVVYTSLAGSFRFQQIASDGTTVVHEQYVQVGAGQQVIFGLPAGVQISISDNERFRIITVGAITLGTVSGSIFVQ